MIKKELTMRQTIRRQLLEIIGQSDSFKLLIEGKVDDAINKYIPRFINQQGLQVNRATLQSTVIQRFDAILVSFKKDNKRHLFIPIVLSALTKGGTTNFVTHQNDVMSLAKLDDLEAAFACAIRNDSIMNHTELSKAASTGVQDFYLYIVSKVGRIEGGRLCLDSDDPVHTWRNVPTYKPKSFDYQDVYRAQYSKITKKEKKQRQQSKIIYDDDNLMVVRPETIMASCFYGQQGRWCLSKPGGSLFRKYEADDGKHFYFVKNFIDDTDTSDLVLQFDKGRKTLDIIWDRNDNPRSFLEFAPKDYQPFIKGSTVLSFIYKVYAFVSSGLSPKTNRESILKMCLTILNEYVNDRRFYFSKPDINAFLSATSKATTVANIEKQYTEEQKLLATDKFKKHQKVIAERIVTFKTAIDKIVNYFKEGNISTSELMMLIPDQSKFYSKVLLKVCQKLNINKKSDDKLNEEVKSVLLKILENRKNFDAYMIGLSKKLIDISLENELIDDNVIQENENTLVQITTWALDQFNDPATGFNVLYKGVVTSLDDDRVQSNTHIIKKILINQGQQVSKKYDDMLSQAKQVMNNYKNVPAYNSMEEEPIIVNGKHLTFEAVMSEKLINNPGIVNENLIIDRVDNRIIDDMTNIIRNSKLIKHASLVEALWDINSEQNLIPYYFNSSIGNQRGELNFYISIELDALASEEKPVFSYTRVLNITKFDIEFDLFPKGSTASIDEEFTKKYLIYPFDELFTYATEDYHLDDRNAERVAEYIDDYGGLEPGLDIYYASAMFEIANLFLEYESGHTFNTATDIGYEFVELKLEEDLWATNNFPGKDDLKEWFSKFVKDYLINDGKSFQHQLPEPYEAGEWLTGKLFSDPNFNPNDPNSKFSNDDSVASITEEITRIVTKIENRINSHLPKFQKNMETIFEDDTLEWTNKAIHRADEDGYLS